MKTLIRCASCENEYMSRANHETGYATDPCSRCGALPEDENDDEDNDRMEIK